MVDRDLTATATTAMAATRTITLTRGQLAVLSLALDAIVTDNREDLTYHKTSPTVRALASLMTAEYRAVLHAGREHLR